MRCATHPEVETNLRCGKCGKPICPKCLVQTPVGARCSDCARLHKLPTYHVSTQYYLRAMGSGLGMAIACGVAWGIIGWLIPFIIRLSPSKFAFSSSSPHAANTGAMHSNSSSTEGIQMSPACKIRSTPLKTSFIWRGSCFLGESIWVSEINPISNVLRLL